MQMIAIIMKLDNLNHILIWESGYDKVSVQVV